MIHRLDRRAFVKWSCLGIVGAFCAAAITPSRRPTPATSLATTTTNTTSSTTTSSTTTSSTTVPPPTSEPVTTTSTPPATISTLPPGSLPTFDNTGVPADVTLTPSTLLLSSDAAEQPTRAIDGNTYKVFSGLLFDFGTTGNYFDVDDPFVLFENCQFTTASLVSNSSSMVQAESVALNGLIFDHCTFDGGPFHNRNAQSDYGLKAIACNCTRFGNAAFEMNNREGDADMEVRDCYLFEPQGWNPSDHVDGIQVGGGRNVTIVNNTVLITPYGGTDGDTDYVSNSALGLWAELGNVTGTVLVDHNYLAGGGRIMYLEQKSPYAWQGPVTVSDNVFDREFTKHGGIWGVLFPDGLPDNLAWTGNIWEDGTAVSLGAATATY